MAWCASLPPESPFPGFAASTAPSSRGCGSVAGGRGRSRRVRRGASNLDQVAAGAALLRGRGDPAAHGRSRGSRSGLRQRARARASSRSPGLRSCGSHRGKSTPPTGLASRSRRSRRAPLHRRAPPRRRSSTSRSRSKDLDDGAGVRGRARSDRRATPRRRPSRVAADGGRSGRARRGRRPRGSREPAAGLRDLAGAQAPLRDCPRPDLAFGVALRAAGDEEDAELELRAALATFERLGATPEVAMSAGPPWRSDGSAARAHCSRSRGAPPGRRPAKRTATSPSSS